MGVSVVTGTFGDEKWAQLAHDRAFKSVPPEIPWIHSHEKTLHEARNKALNSVETEYVIHLDADDELSPNYVESMKKGEADVRAPIVCYIEGTRSRLWRPHVAGHRGHRCAAECLPYGNWVIVGAMARTQLLKDIGGWRDYQWSEDWAMWLGCYQAGATFEWCSDAVYRAHVRRDSRNRGQPRESRLESHRVIARDYGVPVP